MAASIMTLSDLDRVIDAMEELWRLVGVYVPRSGERSAAFDDSSEALATLRQMRERAVEGWVPEWDSGEPMGKYIEFYPEQEPDHPSATYTTKWTAGLLIPGADDA